MHELKQEAPKFDALQSAQPASHGTHELSAWVMYPSPHVEHAFALIQVAQDESHDSQIFVDVSKYVESGHDSTQAPYFGTICLLEGQLLQSYIVGPEQVLQVDEHAIHLRFSRSAYVSSGQSTTHWWL